MQQHGRNSLSVTVQLISPARRLILDNFEVHPTSSKGNYFHIIHLKQSRAGKEMGKILIVSSS